MRRKRKRVTRALIKKYFGPGAKVLGLAGHYRITTRAGGEVVISRGKMRIVHGGDDVYRATVLLMGECWGGGKARGSRESMLALVAHGEAWGVNIQPDFRDKAATLERWAMAIMVVIMGFRELGENGYSASPGMDLFLVFLLAFVVFRLMKREARKIEQRKLETGGFIYPRQAHGAGYADDEQLRKGGVI